MKSTYKLRFYDANTPEEPGVVIPLHEAGKIKDRNGNGLSIETENATVAILYFSENEIGIIPFEGGNGVSAWLYRKIEGIKLKNDFPAGHFKFA